MLRCRRAGLAGWLPVALLLAVALLAGALPARGAAASDWKIVPAESRVTFGYESGGKPKEGHFDRFAGEGHFDPAEPGTATLEVRIDSDSIDLGDRLESDFAKTPEYFNSEEFPHVVYRLQTLTPEGGELYRAAGELTIRNHTRPVETAIRLVVTGETARAEGILTVLRKDFHFGVGPSSFLVNLGPEITVRFDLTAQPAQ